MVENIFIFMFDKHEMVVVTNLPLLGRSKFLPESVIVGSRFGALHPVHRAIYCIALAFPAGADTSGGTMHFEVGSKIAVHPTVAPRRQTGESTPDDDY